MNGISKEGLSMSESLKNFMEVVQDVEDTVNFMEEKNKEIDRLQQRLKFGVNQQQNTKDKITLNQLRESHVKLGNEIKTALKKETDKLNIEEETAEREKVVLLDENNETYIKRTILMKQYKRFLDLWTAFHRQQVDYRDSIKNLLKTRYKVINENATDEEIENLASPTKGIDANSVTNFKPQQEEAMELQNRCSELNQLESFIGVTHNLLSELHDLMSEQEANDVTPNTEDGSQHNILCWRKMGAYIILTSFIAVIVTIMILSMAGFFVPISPKLTPSTTPSNNMDEVEHLIKPFVNDTTEPSIRPPPE